MRLVLVCIGLLGFAAVARAQGPANCLAPHDMQEVVAAKDMVAPAAAVIAARRAVPGADVLRASLCRQGEAMVYVIVALRRDGRVVQVTVDAASGKVKSTH